MMPGQHRYLGQSNKGHASLINALFNLTLTNGVHLELLLKQQKTEIEGKTKYFVTK